MASTNGGGHSHPQSTAKIGGHPLHPMLIPFPIVCFIGAFVADVVFLKYGGDGAHGWAVASRILLLVGLIMAALAAVTGLTDYFGEKRIQVSDAVKHMLANVTAVVLELVNFFLRLKDGSSIGSTGVYISLVVVLILLYSGWKGGDLVYRHGIGVNDEANVG